MPNKAKREGKDLPKKLLFESVENITSRLAYARSKNILVNHNRVRAKKFALIGTSCIGKTTLIEELNVLIPKRLKKKVALSSEAARYYFERKKVRKPFSYYNQSAVQRLAKKFEKEAERHNPDIIICDRSVFDAVAYVHAVGRKEDAQKLYNRVTKWLRTYEHLFLLDPEGVPYQTDNVRRESEETRRMFHDSFAFLLSSSDLPFTLISGNLKKRANDMLQIISSSYEKI